jgi:DNA repair exonuclease SbcCD ATPase subunit
VTAALNIGDVNMADQHDRPFLLFDSPGEVARTLNRVVRLDDIDTALGNVQALKRQNDQEVRVQEVRFKELREREAAFPDLDGVEEYVAMLEDWERELAEKSGKARGLRAVQESLAELRARLAAVQVPDEMGERVEALAARQEELEQKRYTLGLLRGRQAELVNLRTRLALLQPALAQDGWVSELLTKNAQLGAKRRHITRLRSLGKQITDLRSGLGHKRAIIGEEEVRLRGMLPPECAECPLFMEGEK